MFTKAALPFLFGWTYLGCNFIKGFMLQGAENLLRSLCFLCFKGNHHCSAPVCSRVCELNPLLRFVR